MCDAHLILYSTDVWHPSPTDYPRGKTSENRPAMIFRQAVIRAKLCCANKEEMGGITSIIDLEHVMKTNHAETNQELVQEILCRQDSSTLCAFDPRVHCRRGHKARYKRKVK